MLIWKVRRWKNMVVKNRKNRLSGSKYHKRMPINTGVLDFINLLSYYYRVWGTKYIERIIKLLRGNCDIPHMFTYIRRASRCIPGTVRRPTSYTIVVSHLLCIVVKILSIISVLVPYKLTKYIHNNVFFWVSAVSQVLFNFFLWSYSVRAFVLYLVNYMVYSIFLLYVLYNTL